MSGPRKSSLPWRVETIGHASVEEIAENVAASLAHSENTDATWIINAEGRIVAFMGNGPRQGKNAALILEAVAALLALREKTA